MSRKYKVRDRQQLYFITISVVQWIDVFTRTEYKDILIDSLKFCQKEKGLVIYAWCIMTNHLHLIISQKDETHLENIIRDFKKYTSVHIVRAIENNHIESRKKWLLWMFSKLAKQSSKHLKYCFWQEGFHPIELSDNYLMDQKLEYIHQNPVKAGIVYNPEDYIYSSALDYAGKNGLLKLEFIQ